MTRIPGVVFVQGRNSYADADHLHFGIAIHNTSNNASDENEASYATRRTDGVSSHLYVDNDSVKESLDLDARAGHAGSRIGNENALAVEITGGNGNGRDWWLANVDWAELSAALAWIIQNDPDFRGFQVRRASVAEMRTNPKVQAFYGHDDMRQAWGGTTHTDPGPNFPWDKLIGSVKAALGQSQPPSSQPPVLLQITGMLDRATILRWQQYMGTPVDGVITQPPGRSSLTKRVQEYMNERVDARLPLTGQGIIQNGSFSTTISALQAYLRTPRDGRLSTPSEALKELQRRLNTNTF